MTLTASVDARPLGSDGLPAADGREPSERARSNHKVFVATLAVLALLSLLLGGMDRALIAVALLLGALGAVMIIVAVLLRPFAVFSALLGRRG